MWFVIALRGFCLKQAHGPVHTAAQVKIEFHESRAGSRRRVFGLCDFAGWCPLERIAEQS